MTDPWVVAGVIVAVGSAVASLILALIAWLQFKNARTQLQAEREKVERLGSMVDSLTVIAQSQKDQLAAILARLQLQNLALQLQQRDTAVREEGLAWQKLVAFGKFASWLIDHSD